MALDQNDQFYLQRPVPGSKDYEKIKTTVGDLDTYIVGGITTDYNDLSNRLDQEIIDREQGDNNLELQIEEVNNRLADVGSEIFAVVVNGTFKYRIAQYCKEEYQVDIAGCADITDPYLKADCLDTSLDNYHKCVANNVLYNSVGGVYLVSSVYNYETTESIFLSSSDDDGQEIVFEDIMEGDFIEVVGTKMISDGTNQIEVIDNTNYAIYEIKKTSEHVYEEASDSPGFTTKNLHRFDVSYRNSSGKPSVNNRYFVKIMLDMERQRMVSRLLK